MNEYKSINNSMNFFLKRMNEFYDPQEVLN